MLTKQEHESIIKEVMTAENEVDRLKAIDKLTSNFDLDRAEFDKATQELNTATAERDIYRDRCNKYFLQQSAENTALKENNSNPPVEKSKTDGFKSANELKWD